MKCVLNLEDVIFRLNQDEDILISVIDYATGAVLIDCQWKKSFLSSNSVLYYRFKDFEVSSFSPFYYNGKSGLVVTIIYY